QLSPVLPDEHLQRLPAPDHSDSPGLSTRPPSCSVSASVRGNPSASQTASGRNAIRALRIRSACSGGVTLRVMNSSLTTTQPPVRYGLFPCSPSLALIRITPMVIIFAHWSHGSWLYTALRGAST